MTGSDERAIGRLEGKIDLMLAEQEKAAQARKQTYEKLDALDRKVDATKGEVASVDARLKKVEEPVAEFSRWRERFIGMALLITFVAGSIGAAAAWVAGKIMALFSP
jgi:hypothetical protein